MIKAEIISPEGVIFSDLVDFIVAPYVDGEIGVLPKHTPILTNLKKGEIRFKKGEEIKKFNIEGGFLEAMPDKVIILCNGNL